MSACGQRGPTEMRGILRVTLGTSTRRSGHANKASRHLSLSTFRARAAALTLVGLTAGAAVATAGPAAARPMPKRFGARSDYYAGYKTVPAARSVAATFQVPALHC